MNVGFGLIEREGLWEREGHLWLYTNKPTAMKACPEIATKRLALQNSQTITAQCSESQLAGSQKHMHKAPFPVICSDTGDNLNEILE